MSLEGRKPDFVAYWVNNKGEDQPVHLGSLISTFVIHFLEHIIAKLDTSKISIF